MKALLLVASLVPAALPGAERFPEALHAQLEAAVATGGGESPPAYTNRLVLEASPYLRQHAHNPVDWRPWGPAAFADARRLGRPVLVSIGYSTCHWCHVMEEESFADPDVARVLNQHFVAIKVDRETRPDVDSVYMTALQGLTGRGGWPANLWLTPDAEPFYGGTYFPREHFLQVLRQIHDQWTRDPDGVARTSQQLRERVALQLTAARAQTSWSPDPAPLERAARIYRRSFDARWGGLAGAPKFPSGLPVRWLLRWQRRTGDREVRRMASLTLERMAAGGIRDQLGGGFHRYSTDAQWRVPHFEKMLYDNALLTIDYVEAWQATGRDDFAAVAREILDYLAREMSAPEGGFYSATDADSAGPDGEPEEGRYFTWTPAEIVAALGPEAGAAVSRYYGVVEAGPLEGRSVLYEPRPDSASRFALAAEREALRAVRSRRPAPLRDEKVLAAWNGLAVSAFARAGFAFGEPAYVARSRQAAALVLSEMRSDGRLRRVWQAGSSSGPAFLEDYAFVIAGLLDLHEADSDPRWLREAIALQRVLDRHYADPEGGGYFKTADDHEAPLVREKPSRDGAVPSGNSVAALNLLRLHALTGDQAYRARAGLVLSAFRETLENDPARVSELLLALDFALEPTQEIVVVEGAGLDALLAPLRETYAPSRFVLVVAPGDPTPAELVPAARGKLARDGRATAYVCRDRVCDAPTSDPAVLREQVSRVTPFATR